MLPALLAACQTAPVKFHEHQRGQWTGRVQVLSKKKSIPVTVLFKADSLNRLRMDITTVSGFYVASVLVDGDEFKALMARERKFYKGKIRKKTMKRILSLPINPKWLSGILFEAPLDQWQCQYAKNYLKECSQSEDGFKVTWINRVLDQRSLKVQVEDVAADMFLSEFKPIIDDEKAAFKLSPPSGFKIITVR